jgi:hypothetical protein
LCLLSSHSTTWATLPTPRTALIIWQLIGNIPTISQVLELKTIWFRSWRHILIVEEWLIKQLQFILLNGECIRYSGNTERWTLTH